MNSYRNSRLTVAIDTATKVDGSMVDGWLFVDSSCMSRDEEFTPGERYLVLPEGNADMLDYDTAKLDRKLLDGLKT